MRISQPFWMHQVIKLFCYLYYVEFKKGLKHLLEIVFDKQWKHTLLASLIGID